MFPTYAPTLQKPSKDSSSWYKNFHNIFYLSQLSNLTLLTYVDSFIELDKADMVKEFEDDLINKKIIRIDKENNAYSIIKESEFKSIHIGGTLNGIIREVILGNDERTQVLLRAMGLEIADYSDKDIEIDLDKLIDKTTAKNWYEVIRGFLNTWEFLFLYSTVESTFKEILDKKGVVREEELLNLIYQEFPALEDEMGAEKKYISDLWSFYTELRNIYSHSHGLISKLSKSNIGGKLEKAKQALDKIHLDSISLIDTDQIFKKHLIVVGKFHFMKDNELNIFRNLITSLMESLDVVSIEKTRG